MSKYWRVVTHEWAKSPGAQIVTGFVLSLAVAGAAMAAPRLVGSDAGSSVGSASDPVGEISVVQALDSVVLGTPEAEPTSPADSPSPGAKVKVEPAQSPTATARPTPEERVPTPTQTTPAAVPSPPAPVPSPPAPTGPCASQPSGSPIAVKPDPVQLAPGVYQGSFTIYQCVQGGTNWTITKPPSVSTSGDSGTLEGGASQKINFTIDESKLSAGPFDLKVKVSAPGQNIYVDLKESKPATSGIGDLGTTGDGGAL